MLRARRTCVVAASCCAFVLTGGASGLAEPGDRTVVDDGEMPITCDARTRATAAALAVTGGGWVTDTESGAEASYYEVEVTLADGTVVDVHLDQFFAVVGASTVVGSSAADRTGSGSH
jgi:hypothetical protein